MTKPHDLILQIAPQRTGELEIRATDAGGRMEVEPLHRVPEFDASAFQAALLLGHRGTRHGQPSERATGTRLMPREWARSQGSRLFETLLPESVGSLYRRNLRRARRDGKTARVLLRIDRRCPEAVHTLPWEMLFDPEEERYLSLDPRGGMLRSLESRAPTSVRPALELRVLVVLAGPRGLPALAAEEEWRGMRRATRRCANLHLEPLRNPSWQQLREMLQNASYQVLHFIGHGYVDEATHQPSLALVTAEEGEEPADLTALLQAIAGVDSLRLVFLNACETARGGSSSEVHTHSLAEAIVETGIPAALAMRIPVSDRAAIRFSGALYRALATGSPLDQAVAEARNAIWNAGLSLEWTTPILVAANAELQIFVPRWRPLSRRLTIGLGAALFLLVLVGTWFLFQPLPRVEVNTLLTTTKVSFRVTEEAALFEEFSIQELLVPEAARITVESVATGKGCGRSEGEEQSATARPALALTTEQGSLKLDTIIVPRGALVYWKRLASGRYRLSLEGMTLPVKVTARGPVRVHQREFPACILSGGQTLDWKILPRSGTLDLELKPNWEQMEGEALVADPPVRELGVEGALARQVRQEGFPASGIELLDADLPIENPNFLDVDELEDAQGRLKVTQLNTGRPIAIELKGRDVSTRTRGFEADERLSLIEMRGSLVEFRLNPEWIGIRLRGSASQVWVETANSLKTSLIPSRWSAGLFSLVASWMEMVLVVVALLVLGGLARGWWRFYHGYNYRAS